MWPHVNCVARAKCAVGVGICYCQNMFFWWYPMYWAYQNFKVCVICTLDMPEGFHKWFESFWLICLLDIHLLTYVSLDFVIYSSCLW